MISGRICETLEDIPFKKLNKYDSNAYTIMLSSKGQPNEGEGIYLPDIDIGSKEATHQGIVGPWILRSHILSSPATGVCRSILLKHMLEIWFSINFVFLRNLQSMAAEIL